MYKHTKAYIAIKIVKRLGKTEILNFFWNTSENSFIIQTEDSITKKMFLNTFRSSCGFFCVPECVKSKVWARGGWIHWIHWHAHSQLESKVTSYSHYCTGCFLGSIPSSLSAAEIVEKAHQYQFSATKTILFLKDLIYCSHLCAECLIEYKSALLITDCIPSTADVKVNPGYRITVRFLLWLTVARSCDPSRGWWGGQRCFLHQPGTQGELTHTYAATQQTALPRGSSQCEK